MAVCYDRSRAFYAVRLRSFSLGIRYRLHIDGIHRLIHHRRGVRELVVLGDDSDQNYYEDHRSNQRQYNHYKKRIRHDKNDYKVRNYKV